MENRNTQLTRVMSVRDWIIPIIISLIPVIGLIMLLIWTFSKGEINENKKNWAKALLIVQVIGMVLTLLIYIFLIGTAFAFYKAGT